MIACKLVNHLLSLVYTPIYFENIPYDIIWMYSAKKKESNVFEMSQSLH